jgi:predicted DNA-binding transcriptional regulator AlpA
MRLVNLAPLPRLITRPDVQRMLGVSKSAVYRLIDGDPDFPRPLVIGFRCVRWLEHEIAAYIELLAQRRPPRRGRQTPAGL